MRMMIILTPGLVVSFLENQRSTIITDTSCTDIIRIVAPTQASMMMHHRKGVAVGTALPITIISSLVLTYHRHRLGHTMAIVLYKEPLTCYARTPIAVGP